MFLHQGFTNRTVVDSQVPERVLNTVRVTVSTRQEVEQRVRIGILIVGEQDKVKQTSLVQV